jgi:hypothetical protein
MDKKLKAKWVDALRSGKFKQGAGVLRDQAGGFCCLGVLCEVVNPKLWVEGDYGAWFHANEELMPDPSILQKARVDYDDAERLASLNDNGKSFEEIAAHIEANL